jgi:hypothetical protein
MIDIEVPGSRCLEARHGMLELDWIAVDSGLQAWAGDDPPRVP